MKIMLSNAPWYEVDLEKGTGLLGCRAGSRWPHMRDYKGSMISRYQPFPFFLATASAMLKQKEFDVTIRDSIVIGETYDSYYRFIEELSPDLIVLEVSTPSIKNDFEIAAEIKRLLPCSEIVFVGLHAPLEDASFLKNHPCIDYTIYGEYEHPLMLLAQALRSGSDLNEVPNLVFRTGDDISKTSREPLIPIWNLPWPDRDSLSDTYYDGCGGMIGKELQIHTSRGCPFKCNFCVLPQIIYGGSHYRMRDPADVVREIKFNMEKGQYTHFYIDDDTINIYKSHFMELCRLIRESGLSQYPWACMGRGDLMDDEMLYAMKSAGCYSIKYGIESFDRQVLELSGKSLDLNKVIENVYKTQALGIRVHLTYCLGMLGDTVDTVKNTIDKSLELESDSRQYSIASPFVGSRLWHEYRKIGLILNEDYNKYDANHAAVVNREELPADELVRLKLMADELSKKQLKKRVTSQYRTKEFEDGIRNAVMGASAVIVAGTARIPAQLRISEIISECVANVHLVTSRNDEQFPSDNSGISLIVLSVVSGGEIGRSIKGRYDIAVIPLKTFNTDGAEGIINALSNLCKQIILIYGQGRIEALQR